MIGFFPTREPWMVDAACARTDPEEFYPEVGGSNRRSKAICSTCPSKAPCLQYALDNNEQYGIWRGTSRADRQKLQREQGVAA